LSATNLLEVKHLSVSLKGDGGYVPIVRDVCFTLAPGQITGLVGESGSGKSIMSFSLIGLLPRHNSRIDSGEVLLNGQDLLRLPPSELTKMRGRDISMIFQEPMTSLNPVLTVGDQLIEVFTNHGLKKKADNRQQALALLERVGIPRAEEILKSYPHQLSGGMRQRVMIAMAIALKPKLLIADEPTTALDATIQAQILRLLEQLAQEDGMAVIFISHNLGVIARICARIMVMYSGQIVESADTESLCAQPRHPYTQSLLACIPHIGMSGQRLTSIDGTAPNPADLLPGCRFAQRCLEAETACGSETQELLPYAEDSLCRCRKVRSAHAS
jgi:peptide/nickel transport system ATP-binding protein